MTVSWRSAFLTLVGAALAGLLLGTVMGVVWWWVTPTEKWVKVEGGLGAAQISSPSWFAADGWFLILGVVFGLLLATMMWVWARRQPVAMVVGFLVGAGLMAVVAWSVGGVLGPPDPTTTSQSLAVGATLDGSLGLRALGVLAAPAISGLALLAMLLATVSTSNDRDDQVPEQPVMTGGF